MTERLPKKLEKYLLQIAEHEGELGYIKEHLESLSFDDAYSEMVLLEGLYDRKLIYTQGDTIDIWNTDDPSHGITFKPSFFLTSEAKIYLEDLRKTKWKQFARIALSVLTALGAIAAIINLILFIHWH